MSRSSASLAVLSTAAGLVLLTSGSASSSPPGSVVGVNVDQGCPTQFEHFSDDGLWAAYVGYQCPGSPAQFTAYRVDLTTGAVTAVTGAGVNVQTVDVDDDGDVVWAGYDQQGGTVKLWHAADATTTTVPVSTRTGGADQFFSGQGLWISDSGQYVGFGTGSRLVDADQDPGTQDVYVRDLWDPEVAYDWVQLPGDAQVYDLSADGRHLAFGTGASIDLPLDTNTAFDVYEADLGVGSISYHLVGLPNGALSPNGTGGPGSNMLSADGNRVLFATPGYVDAWVYDRTTGQTWPVGRDALGQWTNSYAFAMDATGTQVATLTNGFGPGLTQDGWALSDGTVLTQCDAKNQTLVEDLTTGWIDLASVSTTGGPATGGPVAVDDCNGISQPLAVSAGGQRVAMKSNRLDLVSPALTPATVLPSGALYTYDRDRPALPVALTSPSVSGAAVGSDASCAPGTWYPAAYTDLSYAWRVNGVVVPDESATTYRVRLADAGRSLRCDVTGTDSTGSTTASSAPVVVPTVAPPVAGTVTVTGTAALGGTLTCSPGTWGGSPAPDLFYDWTRAGTTGSVGTATTYVLSSADVTHAVRCTVTGVNVAGTASRASSNSVTLAAPPTLKKAPALSSAPSPPRPGSTLSCSAGSWTGAVSFQYSFARNGVTVQALGAATTHVLTASDVGTSWTCTVRATNAGGSTDATSAALAVPPAPTNVTAPLLSWRNPLRSGTKLSTSTGTWTPTSPTLSYSYAWTRDGAPIAGATGSTYTVASADVGHQVRSQVRATSSSGSSAWVSSSNAAQP